MKSEHVEKVYTLKNHMTYKQKAAHGVSAFQVQLTVGRSYLPRITAEDPVSRDPPRCR